MKLGFVVNNVLTEQASFTTTRLAMAAINRGHEAWLLGVGDFVYEKDGSIHANARSVRGREYDDLKIFLAELQGDEARIERTALDNLDILLERSDPSDEMIEHAWAQTPGLLFGQLARARGVIVLNDPVHLANALNKTYFQHFPEQVRPQTCISRSPEEIKDFI